VETTCKGIPELDVCEEYPIGDKVTKPGLAVKEHKDKIVVVQFKYDMKINELQMKLQLTTSQEVRD